MRIRVEPKEFFMYSVFLAFNPDQPDAEDKAVKAYLAEHELEPKVQGKDTLDDKEFDVMYFGGCYLGKHLNVIGDMQRKAVEREMLALEIERILKEETTDPAIRMVAENTPEPELKQVIAGLVQEFHHESSFAPDGEEYLKVTLEPALIQQKFMDMVGFAPKVEPEYGF